jgi:hypothetical protein
MEHRDRIKQLAFLVGSGLEGYVEVHDYIHQQSATLKSTFKNLLGQGVSNEQLLNSAEALVPAWANIRTSVTDFEHASASTLTPDETRYLDILSRYVDAIELTVQALVERQRLLLGRAMNATNVTRGVFGEAERNYQDRINNYMALGQELNDAAPLIFS